MTTVDQNKRTIAMTGLVGAALLLLVIAAPCSANKERVNIPEGLKKLCQSSELVDFETLNGYYHNLLKDSNGKKDDGAVMDSYRTFLLEIPAGFDQAQPEQKLKDIACSLVRTLNKASD